MQQKTTSMRCLLIGTGLFFITVFNSCDDKKVIVDDLVEVEFIFKNETDKTISYRPIVLDNNDPIELFSLDPFKEKIFEIREKGSADLTVDNCCEGILDGIQGGNEWNILIVYDDDKCITYLGDEKSKSASNFESETSGNNKFWFTYRFTQSEYEQATDCN